MTIAYDLDGEYADTFTRQGAAQLALIIMAFWRGRGKDVRVEIVPEEFRICHARKVWCVRSNLINGLPR